MPSPADLMELWDELLKEYDEILHIPMSSGLSGSCHAAMGFAEDYDGKVVVVDNKRISVIMKQSVLEAKCMADKGMSADEIKEYLEKDGLNASIYVAVDTLEYLKKSGRVTAAGAAIGSVLNIKPVLQIQGGKLDAYKKVRGMNQATKAMFDGIKSDMETRFAGKDIVIRAAYSGDEEIKNSWEEALKEAFPDMEIEIDSLPISIGCHTGEGAMGLGIMEKMAGVYGYYVRQRRSDAGKICIRQINGTNKSRNKTTVEVGLSCVLYYRNFNLWLYDDTSLSDL